MKIETVSRLSYESRDCKFAYVGKWNLQVALVMKVETASMLNFERQVCLNMKIETASMLN